MAPCGVLRVVFGECVTWIYSIGSCYSIKVCQNIHANMCAFNNGSHSSCPLSSTSPRSLSIYAFCILSIDRLSLFNTPTTLQYQVSCTAHYFIEDMQVVCSTNSYFHGSTKEVLERLSNTSLIVLV